MKSLDEAVCFLFFLMGAQRERQREDKTERERERGEVVENCNKTNAPLALAREGERGR